MTDSQQAIYDAATLLAKTEYDANKALLAKITTFISDVTSIRDGIGYPTNYQSDLISSANQVTQNLIYLRDQALPARITAYENANKTTTSA